MRRRYVLGEPYFEVPPLDFYAAPTGQQVDLCVSVLAGTENTAIAEEGLANEYLSILRCLARMKVIPAIVYAHAEYFDWAVAGPAMSEFHAESVELPSDIPVSKTCFPRDLCMRMGKLTLLNPGCRTSWRECIQPHTHLGRNILVSVLGEGGTTLVAGRTVVTQRRLVGPAGGSMDLGERAFEAVKLAGMSKVLMPLSCVVTIAANGAVGRPYANNHNDRVYALVTDTNGKPHLVIDGTVQMAGFASANPSEMTPIDPCQWLPVVRRHCAQAGVALHEAPPLRVPYALNLQQFEPTGNVIMTGGEPELQKLLERLIGKGRVYPTDIPIRNYPVYRRAGIRCLIGDRPSSATFKLGLL